MGYTTYFSGEFKLDKPLTEAHRVYLTKFAETRRMKRDPDKTIKFQDPARVNAGLKLGPESAYFVGGSGFCGQGRDGDVLDHNAPPSGQPGLWCQWVPTEDGEAIVWDEGEKFYSYEEWLDYIIEHFLGPWGYTLNGDVHWDGEESDDFGILRVKDNVVRTFIGQRVYPGLED